MTAIRFIEHPKDETTRVNFPYDPEVVNIVKNTVPGFDRTYDGTTKTWTVASARVEELASVLERQGHQVLWGDQAPAAEPGIGAFFGAKAQDDHEAITIATDILNDIQPDMRAKVFRAMAKLLYPDMYSARR